VPTLAAGDALAECLRSLESQTLTNFEAVVVDNSGVGRARIFGDRTRLIANPRNVGFGAAVNQAFDSSQAPYLATLNDDAVAHPQWLEALLKDAEANPRAGMFASQVRMAGTPELDSAGMLIAADGSSKQRGHGQAFGAYCGKTETLFPSGSAALYRREMLNQIGAFDESFFLYCEDVDLGLRARWAGWECRYVEDAVVEHRYSHSAGRASPLKAYYVERNRLYTVIKNFPARLLLRAPWAALTRYYWHCVAMLQGRGKAAEFVQSGQPGGQSAALLPFLVLRAHVAAAARLPTLLRERRRGIRTRVISPRQFEELLRRHSISARQVAAL
jgi:GT2 family glycosyltransferase